ncbi:hypothetical protein ACOI1H_07125 [Loktanella sp. DJP18]|uniref:hypothetical protein n=1 Tax=Loktanella sp. DJP18 TaxID=3409788 RepID=UPI003BB7699E
MTNDKSTIMEQITDRFADPKLISQSLLDRTGHAILTGDLPLYLSCYTLPHRIALFEGERDVPDVAALTDIFNDVRSLYANLGVTTLERCCTEATHVGPNRVDAHFESRALAGTQLVLRPIPAPDRASLHRGHLADRQLPVCHCRRTPSDRCPDPTSKIGGVTCG